MLPNELTMTIFLQCLENWRMELEILCLYLEAAVFISALISGLQI